jgi:hypothetical protein
MMSAASVGLGPRRRTAPGVWDTNVGERPVTWPGHGGLSVVAAQMPCQAVPVWMRGCCRSLPRAEIGPRRRAGAGDLPAAGRHPGKGAVCCLQTVRGGGRAPVSR